jgi:hypothetical protein
VPASDDRLPATFFSWSRDLSADDAPLLAAVLPETILRASINTSRNRFPASIKTAGSIQSPAGSGFHSVSATRPSRGGTNCDTMRQLSSAVIWPTNSRKSLASRKFRQTEAERLKATWSSVANASITGSPIMLPTRAATPFSVTPSRRIRDVRALLSELKGSRRADLEGQRENKRSAEMEYDSGRHCRLLRGG